MDNLHPRGRGGGGEMSPPPQWINLRIRRPPWLPAPGHGSHPPGLCRCDHKVNSLYSSHTTLFIASHIHNVHHCRPLPSLRSLLRGYGMHSRHCLHLYRCRVSGESHSNRTFDTLARASIRSMVYMASTDILQLRYRQVGCRYLRYGCLAT